jgi:DNA invertase Pin-like site-specific DNA recombinase
MSPRTKTPTAAAVYCRISLDKDGEGLGVKRQEDLCLKLAAERGWIVAETYSDNDVSAYNGKARAAYQRLLADLEAGRRDAVICVDLDRLTRRPAELEHFMDLADRKKVALANVSGDTDLSTSDGQFKARIMGAVARQESQKKGERVSREAEQAARRGIARGSRRPFGFEDDKMTVRDAEAELIRDAARRVLAGETVPAIARDWNARRIPTPQAAPLGWSTTSVVTILRNPRIAGLRAHKGEIVADACWPAIVDRSTWETLQGRIRRVARVGRPSTHLLSGIARCGRCGGPLWTSWRKTAAGKRVARYACVSRPGRASCGNLAVVAAPVDDLVRDMVIHALAGPALAKVRKARRSDDRAQAEAVRDLADAEERLEVLAELFASGELSRREFAAGRDKAKERIAAATKVLDTHYGVRTDLPTDTAALREKWDAETIEWRRALIGTVVESVTVKPVTMSTNVFDVDRVEIVWKV